MIVHGPEMVGAMAGVKAKLARATVSIRVMASVRIRATTC